MAPVPSHSPITGAEVPASAAYLHASSSHFRLPDGRTILLRGINLAASAKMPQAQPNSKLEGFWESARSGDMSFVGRVLELDDADEHLQRLRGWGFNCLRYVITWEAIEHKGPGIYDQAFLDYTVALLRKCKQHGFYVYMDPHQDLWSRFSGGSGAPYWTLIACGLDPSKFTVTNAATLECEWLPDPSAYPAMIWATNYQRLACLTLFTLWNAGREFAPKCIIDGINIQDWLQAKYFGAMRALGDAIRQAGDLLDGCVIGWDSLNEPNAGLVGIPDLSNHSKESILRIGPTPTPFEAMRLGMGEKVQVENYRVGSLGSKRDGSVVVDPQGVRAWLDSDAESDGSPYGWTRGPDWELGTCIWGLHGVWDPETCTLLQPDYFTAFPLPPPSSSPSSASPSFVTWSPRPQSLPSIEFGRDCWLRHWSAWAKEVRSWHPEAILFVQSPVFQIPPTMTSKDGVDERCVHSTHFYDGLTLVTKHWNWFNADALGILRGHYSSVVLGVKIGEAAIRRCLREQLAMLRADSVLAFPTPVPTMMGEIGIPFDLDGKKAYLSGDYSEQIKALDASLNACDGLNVLNYTIWTYTPDNNHPGGDQWNGEDLSVWSKDDLELRVDDGRLKSSRSAANLGGLGSGGQRWGGSSPKLNFLSLASSRAPSTTSLSSAPGLPTPDPLANEISSMVSPAPAPDLNLDPYSRESSSLPPEKDLHAGARALTAFCRPYPVKCVGTPVNINFDLRTSKFMLELQINHDDVQDAGLPTEVWLPATHYAAFPSASQSPLPRRSSSISITSKENLSRTSLCLPPYGAPSVPLDKSLALKVFVSAGRYEVEGETLRWYHPRPAVGQAPLVVRLSVERIGGPIKMGTRGWRDEGARRTRFTGDAGPDGSSGRSKLPGMLVAVLLGVGAVLAALYVFT